jgi:hypothetical protein
LHTLNAIMHSLRSDFTMKNRHGICGYQAQRAFHLPLRRSRFGVCLPPARSSTYTRFRPTLTISGERNAPRWL